MRFLSFIFIILFIVSCDDNNNKSNFTITADTIIEPGSEISKYVTQEEVDSFAFRYWDIDTYPEDNITKDTLRNLLKSKDTNKILKFLKDNNLSIDVRMKDNTTPLMHSSFYNDENTMKELIRLGADTNATDRYKLSPIAYAIENNSTKAVKTLLDSEVVFKDMWIQSYRRAPYYRAGFDKIVIDGDNMQFYYNGKTTEKAKHGFGDGVSAFGYAIDHNYIEIVRYILESGYNHPANIGQYPESKPTEYSDYHSVLGGLVDTPNHKPMLNLLLEHNVSGQPDDEFLKKEYEKCYKEKESDELFYKYYEINKKRFDDEDIKDGKIPEKENPFFPLQKYIWLKHYNVYCKDENSTFKNTKEYINWKNANNKLKIISPELRDNNPNIIFKNISQDEVMNCYRKLVEPGSSKINLNDNCLNLKF